MVHNKHTYRRHRTGDTDKYAEADEKDTKYHYPDTAAAGGENGLRTGGGGDGAGGLGGEAGASMGLVDGGGQTNACEGREEGGGAGGGHTGGKKTVTMGLSPLKGMWQALSWSTNEVYVRMYAYVCVCMRMYAYRRVHTRM